MKTTIKDSHKEAIIKILSKGGTEGDIEDYCFDNNLSEKAVFHFIANFNAPENCKFCKNVDFYPNMFPCSCCSRRLPVDYYEHENF